MLKREWETIGGIRRRLVLGVEKHTLGECLAESDRANVLSIDLPFASLA